MFQFLLPFLGALGAGGTAAATAAPALGPLAAGAGTAGVGAAGAAGMSSMLPMAGIGGLTSASATPGMLASLFPNIAKFGTSAMGGDVKGMGGALGNMIGGKNLGNMIENPSWANLGKVGEGMGDKMAVNMVTGGQQQQKPPVGPGAIATQQRVSAPAAIAQDPVLNKMYSNLNPQQGFQGSAMKPWPASPYPKRMSAI